MKPLMKQLQTLLEDRDKTVREETKLLVVEIYRWIGPALKPQLASLKPIQVSVVVLSLVLQFLSSCFCYMVYGLHWLRGCFEWPSVL